MLADMEATGGRDAAVRTLAGTVTSELRRKRVLIFAALELDGELIDVDEPGVRHALEQRHAALLVTHGMEHLDIAAIRSRARIVTQTIGRSLHDSGAAGVAFGSNHDGQPCYALFEGHARLVANPDTELIELTPELEILQQVCDEWGSTSSQTPERPDMSENPPSRTCGSRPSDLTGAAGILLA